MQNVGERLRLYAKLDKAADEPALTQILTGIEDRFGPLPGEVLQLADVVRLRWQGCRAGFERLTLKRDTLKGYLPAGDEHKEFFQGEQFGRILNYVQRHPRAANLKERKEQLIVTIEGVASLDKARKVMGELVEE